MQPSINMLGACDGLDTRNATSGRGCRVWRPVERCRIHPAVADAAASQAGRAAAHDRIAQRARRAVPRLAHRLPMAPPTGGIPALADGVRILARLHRRRGVGRDAARPAHGGARGRGARGQPVGRDHRQPERQDDGKGGPRGWDAGKKVRGRKRHIVVDTLGFLLAVLAHPADIQDRPGAVSLLPRLQGVVLYADSGYAGPMVETACQALGDCLLVTIAKDAAAQGFHVLPKRWVVERTLAWLCRNRRLSKDYEHLPAVSEAFVKLAMIRLMTARLT